MNAGETGGVEFPNAVQRSAAVLMITGALDATNPIENARAVARGFSIAVVLEVENVAHEALPVGVVQDLVVAYFSGGDVRNRRLVAERPRFTSVDEASQAPPQRRR